MQKKHKRKKKKNKCGGLDEIGENVSDEMIQNKEQEDFDIAALDREIKLEKLIHNRNRLGRQIKIKLDRIAAEKYKFKKERPTLMDLQDKFVKNKRKQNDNFMRQNSAHSFGQDSPSPRGLDSNSQRSENNQVDESQLEDDDIARMAATGTIRPMTTVDLTSPKEFT